MTTMMQLANQWKEMQGMQRYRRAALTDKMEQDTNLKAECSHYDCRKRSGQSRQDSRRRHDSSSMSAADLKSLRFRTIWRGNTQGIKKPAQISRP